MTKPWELNNGILHLAIEDFGARIIGLSYTKDTGQQVPILQNAIDKWQQLQSEVPPEEQAQDHPYTTQCPILAADDTGGFAMLPICNRVKSNLYELETADKRELICLKSTSLDGSEYLHGRAWLSSWQLKEYNHSNSRLTLSFKDQGSIESGYDYEANLTYELIGSSLQINLELTHFSVLPRYYGLGFHPYFVFDKAKDELKVTAGHVEPPDDGYLTADSQPLSYLDGRFDYSSAKPFTLDDLYDITNHAYGQWEECVLFRKEGNVIVTLKSPSSNYLMMYTQKGARFLALEPQTHAVNGVNTHDKKGLMLMHKGQTMAYQCYIEIIESGS